MKMIVNSYTYKPGTTEGTGLASPSSTPAADVAVAVAVAVAGPTGILGIIIDFAGDGWLAGATSTGVSGTETAGPTTTE